MKISTVMLLVFGFTSIAKANDDCQFNFEGFQSPLDAQHYTVKKSSKVVRDDSKKTLRQDLTLDNGVKIEFQGGGCAHMAYSFSYSGFKQRPGNLNELLYLALSLMVETPTVQTDSLKETWLRNLTFSNRDKIVETSKGLFTVPCGAARCNLDSTARGKISVSYDFAL